MLKFGANYIRGLAVIGHEIIYLVDSHTSPDSNVHRANMGPTCVLSAPDGPHVGPMNVAFRDDLLTIIGHASSITITLMQSVNNDILSEIFTCTSIFRNFVFLVDQLKTYFASLSNSWESGSRNLSHNSCPNEFGKICFEKVFLDNTLDCTKYLLMVFYCKIQRNCCFFNPLKPDILQITFSIFSEQPYILIPISLQFVLLISIDQWLSGKQVTSYYLKW